MSTPLFPGGRESSEPNDPDGLMNDQVMPTSDGQMASNTSEEERPPTTEREAAAETQFTRGTPDDGTSGGQSLGQRNPGQNNQTPGLDDPGQNSENDSHEAG